MASVNEARSGAKLDEFSIVISDVLVPAKSSLSRTRPLSPPLCVFLLRFRRATSCRLSFRRVSFPLPLFRSFLLSFFRLRRSARDFRASRFFGRNFEKESLLFRGDRSRLPIISFSRLSSVISCRRSLTSEPPGSSLPLRRFLRVRLPKLPSCCLLKVAVEQIAKVDLQGYVDSHHKLNGGTYD